MNRTLPLGSTLVRLTMLLMSLMVLILVSPLSALEAPPALPDACTAKDDDSFVSLFGRCQDALRKGGLPGAAQQTETAMTDAQKALAGKVSAANPADTFAGRVNDSLADFLPLFQGAVSATPGKDNQSLTLAFNLPLLGRAPDAGQDRNGLSVTFAEPKAFEPFAKTIVESVRKTQSDELLKAAGDFADPTWTYRYALRRKPTTWDQPKRLFGRDVRAYDVVIRDLVQPVLDDSTQKLSGFFTTLGATAQAVDDCWSGPLGLPMFNSDAAHDFKHSTRKDLLAKVDAATLEKLKGAPCLSAELTKLAADEKAPERALAALREKAKGDIQGLFGTGVAELARLDNEARKGIDDALDGLDRLIENQPELVLSASFRDPKKIVGPREESYSLTYEAGSYNLNRALQEFAFLQKRSDPATAPGGTGCEPDQDLRLCAFRRVAEDPGSLRQIHTTFTLTYRNVRDYDFEHKYELSTPQTGGADLKTEKTASLDLPGGSEWRLRLGISRSIAWRSEDTKKAILGGQADAADSELGQFKFDVEGCRFDDAKSLAKELRRNDRLIARATWILPTSKGNGGTSIPLSITYANKPEFFGEKDGRQFSAHIAISYKLLTESAKTGKSTNGSQVDGR